jgi:hypothetical protein
MGTHGFFVFKYKGIYYTYYQHYDSYPERPGLGQQIVDEVKKLTLEDIERIKSLLLNIKLTNENEENQGNSKFDTIFHAIENSNEYCYHTSKKEPDVGDYDVSYIYIINFDLNIIKMKNYYNTCTFCFDYIPDNWVEIFRENYPGY